MIEQRHKLNDDDLWTSWAERGVPDSIRHVLVIFPEDTITLEGPKRTVQYRLGRGRMSS